MFLSRKALRARQREAENTRRNRLEVVKALSHDQIAMESPGSSVRAREIRRKLGLNQREFWTRIGVTQSAGSRYEGSRKMPKPVWELLRLVHVERLELSKITKEDFDIVDRLKSQDPELYRRLRQASRVKPRKAGERGSARGQRTVCILPRTSEAQVE